MFGPGDIIIDTCTISGVDVRTKVRQISVFEHILKPYIALKLVVFDSGDILNWNIGLNGKNPIDLSFHQPGQEPYSQKFLGMVVEKSTSLENMRTTVYTLNGYSTHMDHFPKVQKSYKNKTATSIARNLVEEYVKPRKSLVIEGESKGMLGNDRMPYNINGIQIYKAIRAVLARAASSQSKSSAYSFFERNKEMVIGDLELMLKNAVQSPQAKYIQRPMGQNWLRDQMMQNFTILSYIEETRVNLASTSQNDDQSVQPYDLFSQGFDPSSIGQKGKASTFLNIPYNIMRPATHLAQVLPARKKFTGEMDSQSLTIHVAFNPALTVSKGFDVEILAPPGDTDIHRVDRVSGPHMITETRHMVKLDKTKMMGTSTVKGIKGTIPDELKG